MDPYVGYVIIAGLILMSIALIGGAQSRKTLRWCKQQQQHLEQARKTGNHTLDPLKARQNLLQKMSQTILAEGDLGSLLLQRSDVPGQHAGSHYANVLVSLALFFTILGLIGTLWGLGGSLAIGVRQAASADAPDKATASETQADFTDLMHKVQGPLGHLPWLFGPTGVGLFLAVLLNLLQRYTDTRIEETWQRLDDYTLDKLPPPSDRRQALGRLVRASELLVEAAQGVSRSMGDIRQGLEELSKLDQAQWAQQLMDAARAFSGEVDNSGTVLRDVSGRLTKSLALIPEATNTLGHAAAEMQQAVQGMSQSASSLKDVVGESKGLVGDVIKAQQELTELREDVGHLAARMAELNANFGGWSGTSQGLLKDIKQVVADLKIEVDGFLEQTRLFNKDVAANADATRDALEKAREGLDNSARQLEALLSQQQQTFRGLSRQMADSLREGHQRFLVEVNGRFDQGEGLYEQLDQLRISLDRDAHELQQFGGHMATLSPLLQGHQDLVQTSQGALRQLGHAVAALIEDFERQREFEAQRQQAWQEHLEAQRALDQEREEQRERAWQEHVKATQREVAAEFEKLEELLEPLRRLESLGQLDRLQQSLDRSAGALQKVADRLDRRWEWPWKRRAPRA